MMLGALLDAGLPLDELKRALGSLARRRATTSRAEQVLRAGVSATKFMVHETAHDGERHHEHMHARGSARPCMRTRTRAPVRRPRPHGHDAARITQRMRTITHRSLPEIFALIDRSRAVAGRARSREGAVPAAGRSRGGDSPDAGRAGPPARGRRPRLDHRHRRRGVRARVGCGADRDRLLAAERRRRHGALGARTLSGAGAGDGEAARRRADLQRQRCRRSWSRRPAR